MSQIDDDIDYYQSNEYYTGTRTTSDTLQPPTYQSPYQQMNRHQLSFSSSPFFTPSAVDSATAVTNTDTTQNVAPIPVAATTATAIPSPAAATKPSLVSKIKQLRRPLPSAVGAAIANTEQSRELIFNRLIQSRKMIKVIVENKTGHTVGNFIFDTYGSTHRSVVQVAPGQPIEYVLSPTELITREIARQSAVEGASSSSPGSHFFARISVYIYFRDADGSIYSRPFTYTIVIAEDQLAKAIVDGQSKDYTQEPAISVVASIVPEQTLDSKNVADAVERQRAILRGQVRESALGPMNVALDPMAPTTNYEQTLVAVEPRGKQEEIFGVHSSGSHHHHHHPQPQPPTRTDTTTHQYSGRHHREPARKYSTWSDKL